MRFDNIWFMIAMMLACICFGFVAARFNPWGTRTIPVPNQIPHVQAGATDPGHTFARIGPTYIYPIASLTPGAINLNVTQSNIDQTICNPKWSTKGIRDTQSTPAQKATMYVKYQIPKPKNNTGANQTCELDHLISLELGGGDTLNNIWPECGPTGAPLNQRYFKEKDQVENYLHSQICAGNMLLESAQTEIVADWYGIYIGMRLDAHKYGGILRTDASDPDDGTVTQ